MIKKQFIISVGCHGHPLEPVRVVLWIQCKSQNIRNSADWLHGSMFCFGTTSISIFCWHLLKMFSTHFITLVSFYSTCNISENQRFPDHLLGHRKRLVTWNDWKSFNHHLLILLLIYVTEDNLYNWKVTYKKWNCWFSSSNLSPIILIKLFLFFLTLL